MYLSETMAEPMNDLSGKEWLQYSFSIWRDIRKNPEEIKLKHPAMYPEQLAARLIKIYTKKNDMVLDPFAGIGSTLIAARNLERNGFGIELNPEYVEICKNRLLSQKVLSADTPTPKILCGDSRILLKKIASNSVDLCVNSPPYWDILNQKRTADNRKIRNYSDSDKDLGNIEDYERYLDGLRDIYSEIYRILKPDKRCCIVVMDIRKKDKFYPLHIDITKTMEKIGFELEEYVIWDRQHEYNNMRTLGYPWVFRFNKVHEFVCIFWKRSTKKSP